MIQDCRQSSNRYVYHCICTVYQQGGSNDTSLVGGSTNFIDLSFKVEFHDMLTLGFGICELWWCWDFRIQNGGMNNFVVGGLSRNSRIGNCDGIWKLYYIQFSIWPLYQVWLKIILCPPPYSSGISRFLQMAISFIEISHKSFTNFHTISQNFTNIQFEKNSLQLKNITQTNCIPSGRRMLTELRVDLDRGGNHHLPYIQIQ